MAIDRREHTDKNKKGKKFSTMVIAEPLQSSILKVQNKTVYMTGKRYFTIENFLKHFYMHDNYINVVNTKIGFAVVLPEKKHTSIPL